MGFDILFAVSAFGWLVSAVIAVCSMAFVFRKAGIPPLAAFIPVYNTAMIWKVSGRRPLGGYLFCAGVSAVLVAVFAAGVLVVPASGEPMSSVLVVVGLALAVLGLFGVWWAMVAIDVGVSFGLDRPSAFALLVLFPIVGWPYLAFIPSRTYAEPSARP